MDDVNPQGQASTACVFATARQKDASQFAPMATAAERAAPGQLQTDSRNTEVLAVAAAAGRPSVTSKHYGNGHVMQAQMVPDPAALTRQIKEVITLQWPLCT